MRGILIIEPLYHQTVAGKKTQTRRTSGLEQINGAPEVKKKGSVIKCAIISNPNDWELDIVRDRTAKFVYKHNALIRKWADARYKIGEVLYIKEPTVKIGEKYTMYQYALPIQHRTGYKWKNKMFMPAEAARAFIRITGIKCERLLDISDEDCVAEGCEISKEHTDVIFKGNLIPVTMYKTWRLRQGKNDPLGEDMWLENAEQAYLSLYRFANKISPKKDVGNPWVWVYTYEYLPNHKL